MIDQILSKMAALPVAEQDPIVGPEEQQVAALGFLEGMKQASLAPEEAATLLGFVIQHSTLRKEADGGDDIAAASGGPVGWIAQHFGDLKNRVHAGVAGLTNPDAVQAAIKIHDSHPELVDALAAGHYGDALMAGGKEFYNWAASPENLKRWAPYAISGLGSMVGAKMLGVSNLGAVGAGLAGGYLGGRVFNGKPIIPQNIRKNVGDFMHQNFNTKEAPAADATKTQTADTQAQAEKQLAGVTPGNNPGTEGPGT